VPKKYWILSRAEYVHDNTKMPAINIWNGLRAKIYGEYFYELSKPNGGLYNIGTDIRYYEPVYKNVVLATRFAYAHSGGNKRINYVMGGVDNWLFAQQSAFAPAPSENFGFQALTTNLRGYPQNARSGNTFGVINVEMRVPLFTTLSKKPIQSSFLKNLQLVGFADAGNAWNGLLPTEENTQRSYPFANQANNVTLILTPPRTDLAIGYGAGIRTTLLGYFMRLDAAWNIEGRRKPMIHFSLGTDF
jgi:outer membrane protein assembly factor BamA